ncbi:MAG: hypothetical protein Q7J15_04835 [Candidatus Desulfaltia sp.]|nr:hypothetical protein [Candidatus Desulfaltia sp.]
MTRSEAKALTISAVQSFKGSGFRGSMFAENLFAVTPAQAGLNPAPAGIREF